MDIAAIKLSQRAISASSTASNFSRLIAFSPSYIVRGALRPELHRAGARDSWARESGGRSATIVRFEPASGRFQTWNIPSGGGVVQQISVTKDGNLALAEGDANKIALVTLTRTVDSR